MKKNISKRKIDVKKELENSDNNTSVKISFWIDLQLKKILIEKAESKGVTYQTFIKNILEDYVQK